MVLAALGSLPSGLPLEDGGHFPPKPQDFWQPLITLGHIGDYEVAITRPMVVVTISVLLLSWWLISTTKNAAIVPSKGQHYTELVYNFVRNDIAKDSIGSKDFFKFVPLLFALFLLGSYLIMFRYHTSFSLLLWVMFGVVVAAIAAHLHKKEQGNGR